MPSTRSETVETSPPPASPSVGAWLTTALAVTALIPPAFAAWYIHAYGVNGAHWDHLMNAELFERYYTGTLTAEYLLRPHLEHLKLFPRLICLGLGLATRFNNVAEMYFQWLLLCATAGVLYLAYRSRLALSGSSLLLRLVPVYLVLFSVRQHEAMLVGDGMITYLCLLSVVTALALLGTGRTGATVGAALAAFVASFSHANGFLLWPLGCLVIFFTRSRSNTGAGTARSILVRSIVWLAPAVAATAVYVFHWPTTAAENTTFTSTHPLSALTYGIQAGGVYFGQAQSVQMWTGVLTLVIEAAVGWLAVVRYRRTRMMPLGVWLILFAIAAQAAIAVGRAGAPREVGVTSRYAAFIGLAISGAYLAALETFKRADGAFARALVGITAATILIGSYFSYADGLTAGPPERDGRLMAVQVLRTVPLQEDAAIASLLFPFPAWARGYAAELERHKLNVFTEPLPDVNSLPMTSEPQFFVDVLNWKPVTGTLTVRPTDTISFSGWAFDRRSRQPYSAGFLRLDSEPRTLPLAYGLNRPDVVEVHHLRRGASVGFTASYSARILHEGQNTLYFEFVLEDPPRHASTPAVATITLVK